MYDHDSLEDGIRDNEYHARAYQASQELDAALEAAETPLYPNWWIFLYRQRVLWANNRGGQMVKYSLIALSVAIALLFGTIIVNTLVSQGKPWHVLATIVGWAIVVLLLNQLYQYGVVRGKILRWTEHPFAGWEEPNFSAHTAYVKVCSRLQATRSRLRKLKVRRLTAAGVSTLYVEYQSQRRYLAIWDDEGLINKP